MQNGIYTCCGNDCRVQRKSFLQLAQGKLKLAFTSPDVISTSPKSFLLSRIKLLISHFFCYSNCSKNITCPSVKLKTEFTCPIANPLAPGYWTLLSLHAATDRFNFRMMNSSMESLGEHLTWLDYLRVFKIHLYYD